MSDLTSRDIIRSFWLSVGVDVRELARLRIEPAGGAPHLAEPDGVVSRSIGWRGSMISRARVRLAHQLISGSSVTACHNSACTNQDIEVAGSHFLSALMTPIESSNTAAHAPSRRQRAAGATTLSYAAVTVAGAARFWPPISAPSGTRPVST
jgi:hypothetical protein